MTDGWRSIPSISVETSGFAARHAGRGQESVMEVVFFVGVFLAALLARMEGK
jgi:hypothetical protein